MADDIRQRILNDPDFIVAPRYDNSLAKWVAAQKEEKATKDPMAKARAEQLAITRAARALKMTVEDVEEVRDEALAQLREELEDIR